MVQKVIKRNGMEVSFDKSKIRAVLNKANQDMLEISEKDCISKETIETIVTRIYNRCRQRVSPTPVEEIQDMVETELMKEGAYELAKHYVKYRYNKSIARDKYKELMSALEDKLMAKQVANQNANVDEESFGGRVGEATSLMTKQFALEYCMSEMARENHLNNEIYIHDLDAYVDGRHNCLSIPFDKLLADGFDTRQTDVRDARSVNTASQLIAVIFQLQSLQQFGGVSATHIDWSLIPYVRISFYKHYKDALRYIAELPDDEIESKLPRSLDKTEITNLSVYDNSKCYRFAHDMTEKEVAQGMEALIHNLNTLQSRSGNQLPFTSVNFGTNTTEEGRMISYHLLQVLLAGIGKTHRTSIFPCAIFQYKRGINNKPGTPNYDLYRLALECTANRLYPNYANCDWSAQKAWVKADRKKKQEIIDAMEEEGRLNLLNAIKDNAELQSNLSLRIIDGDVKITEEEDPKEMFSTMGCRTANGGDVNFDYNTYVENIQSVIETGKLKYRYISAAQKDGRGNICPVTIILPTIAMEAKLQAEESNADVIETFMSYLDVKIHEAKDMLIERFDWICSQNPSSAKFMYNNETMEGYFKEEGIRSALKHGTLAMGQLGLAECLQILIGCDQTEPNGLELAKRIEQLYKDRCAEFKTQYSLNFGVYYTPAENLCYTALKKFREKYGVIENVSDREYFTNSMHVPVWKELGPFDKIAIESQLTGYSSAGCITYVELDGSVRNNIDALETLVNDAMDNDVPYFAVNVPNDHCNDCGFTGEFNDSCVICGSEDIEQLRRVTGYLTGNYKTAFNKGKQAETEQRVKHGKGNI